MDGIRYIWGVDLGEVRDPSAVAVISRTFRDRRWWYVLGGLWQPGPEDVAPFRAPGGDFYEGLQGWLCNMQAPHLPHGARVPYLGHSWMCVDGTGPGRDATIRFLRGRLARTVKLTPFQIRRSEDVAARQKPTGFYLTSRKDLIVTLDSVRDAGRLAFVDGLPLQRLLDKQLSDFRIKESPEDGMKRSDHDDLAMALAMAVTLAERITQVGPGGLTPVRYE